MLRLPGEWCIIHETNKEKWGIQRLGYCFWLFPDISMSEQAIKPCGSDRSDLGRHG